MDVLGKGIGFSEYTENRLRLNLNVFPVVFPRVAINISLLMKRRVWSKRANRLNYIKKRVEIKKD